MRMCDFNKIALRHRCSPANLLHIFRTPFPKNISIRLFLLNALQEVRKTSRTHFDSTLEYKFSFQIKNHSKVYANFNIGNIHAYIKLRKANISTLT